MTTHADSPQPPPVKCSLDCASKLPPGMKGHYLACSFYDPDPSPPTFAATVEAARTDPGGFGRRSLFARIENVLRTAGRAELADELVEHAPSPLEPHGFVEALRSQAANLRLLNFPGTASSLEDMAARLGRSAPTVRSALACAWRCARAGAW